MKIYPYLIALCLVACGDSSEITADQAASVDLGTAYAGQAEQPSSLPFRGDMTNRANPERGLNSSVPTAPTFYEPSAAPVAITNSDGDIVRVLPSGEAVAISDVRGTQGRVGTADEWVSLDQMREVYQSPTFGAVVPNEGPFQPIRK